MVDGLVTVFGGSGFLGRRIVERLADDRHPVRVAVRHPDGASFLQRFGGVGQIELVRADVSDESTVARAVEGSASVINTVGHYVEKRGATFLAIHGEGARHVARQAKQAGVERLIHISGLGADPGSDSLYVRSRGIGENLVRESFEDVTILRPSAIFGPGDALLNKLDALARSSPIIPLFGDGRTRLQPVFVGNVAEACTKVLADPSTAGGVYELGGPHVYAYRDLVRLTLEQLNRRRAVVPVPFLVWDLLAAVLALLPDPPLTRDQVRLLKQDNVVGDGTSALEDLGIRPVAVEEVLTDCIRVSGRG